MRLIKNKLLFLILIYCCMGSCFGFLEIIVGVASYAYQKASCYFGSCCTKTDIPANFDALQTSLRDRIFGQPLVQNTVINALRSHWNANYRPDKALTMSFHGGPGVGKNYVLKLIQEALYSKGTKSDHVHTFVARLDFPEVSQVHVYKRNLAAWIRGNVTKCPRQLFIFDEVNNMPPGVLDVITPFIDYIDIVNGISYKESIFAFLSNTGAQIVNEHAYSLWRQGIDRDDLKLKDFEKYMSQGAFNEKGWLNQDRFPNNIIRRFAFEYNIPYWYYEIVGGFQHSDTIRSNLIDHYIPFLPLMEPHIRLCIMEEFRKRGIHNPSEDQIQDVLEFIDWGPDSDKIFSKTGCKRISQKVGLLVYKNY